MSVVLRIVSIFFPTFRSQMEGRKKCLRFDIIFLPPIGIYVPVSQVKFWFIHRVGGFSPFPKTPIIFENVCSIGLSSSPNPWFTQQPATKDNTKTATSKTTNEKSSSWSTQKHSKYTKLLFIWIRALKESAENSTRRRDLHWWERLWHSMDVSIATEHWMKWIRGNSNSFSPFLWRLYFLLSSYSSVKKGLVAYWVTLKMLWCKHVYGNFQLMSFHLDWIEMLWGGF